MKQVIIDCRGIEDCAEFWRRYIDAAQPAEGGFGRNLDAFRDALAGGPGWPGDCEVILENTAALQPLATSAGESFLEALRQIAEGAVETGAVVKFR